MYADRKALASRNLHDLVEWNRHEARIGELAREDIEDFMGTKVYLQTWVKVKENWRDSMASLRNFGFTQDN